MPKLLGFDKGDGTIDPEDESYSAIVGNVNFVIFGGQTTKGVLSQEGVTNGIAVITRMDLAQNTVRWMRTYEVATAHSRYIDGLALNSAGEKIAVYAHKGN